MSFRDFGWRRTTAKSLLKSDCFFLCVKPREFRKVLEEIRDVVREEQVVVSITSPVMVRDLEEWLPAKVAKVVARYHQCRLFRKLPVPSPAPA